MNFLKTVWSAIAGTASSLLGNWQVTLGAAVIAAGLGAFGTYKVMHNANEAAVTKQAVATVRLVEHQATINTQLGAIYVPQLVFIHDHTNQLQQEVPEHVTPEIDRSYPVPLGFVRMRNAASHGPVPGPAAGGDADPSGVPISDVARADVADEGTLDTCRALNDEWWAWYDQQSAAWNKAHNAVPAP